MIEKLLAGEPLPCGIQDTALVVPHDLRHPLSSSITVYVGNTTCVVRRDAAQVVTAIKACGNITQLLISPWLGIELANAVATALGAVPIFCDYKRSDLVADACVSFEYRCKHCHATYNHVGNVESVCPHCLY